jgi:hypothetical protein
MGYRDLAVFQHKCGDLQGAFRSWVKSREYCVVSQHVLEMCLGVIEVDPSFPIIISLDHTSFFSSGISRNGKLRHGEKLRFKS